MCTECEDLFLKFKMRAGTGGPCATAYQRVGSEAAYQRKAELLLAKENKFKIFIVSSPPFINAFEIFLVELFEFHITFHSSYYKCHCSIILQMSRKINSASSVTLNALIQAKDFLNHSIATRSPKEHSSILQ